MDPRQRVFFTYDRVARAKAIAVLGQVDVHDVAEGVRGILRDAKLALLGISVEVDPLVCL